MKLASFGEHRLLGNLMLRTSVQSFPSKLALVGMPGPGNA